MMQSEWQMVRTFLAFAMITLLGLSTCVANNNLFLPGDEFFPTLLTKDGITTITEQRGMRVLFYSLAFDFQQHRIGLKYNENWVAESKKFGHETEHISYSSLID